MPFRVDLPRGCFPLRCPAGRGQVEHTDDGRKDHRIGQDLQNAQQVEQRDAMRLLRGGAQVEHQRTQQVGGERPDLQRIQQDHEAACKGRMEHPQHGRDEAEQEIDRVR